jgi:hypothetical protein
MQLGISLTVLFFAFSVCADSNTSPNITSETVSATPAVFCKVLNEPDPLLMGGWQTSTIGSPLSKRFDDGKILKGYWLVKNGNQYALYFYEGESSKYRSIGFI